MKQKDLTELIYYAINNWDMNPATKYFAVELASEIKNNWEK